MQAEPIHSRDNALIKTLHKLATDGAAYRKTAQLWLEGEHLVSACLTAAAQVPAGARLVLLASYAPALPDFCARYGLIANMLPPLTLVADALASHISSMDSPAPLGLLLPHPPQLATLRAQNTVVLDRLQDPGNVGSILRSAAAFGFGQILAVRGTVALYSPKVLRAAMGAHFALQLHEQLAPEQALAQLQNLRLPLLTTCVHQGQYLHASALPTPCAWVLGHEGQGTSTLWQNAATHQVRIAQPGGQESLNVAAAAAICLHASAASLTHGPSAATRA